MKSKKIEIEIVSPNLDDKMIEEVIEMIKSKMSEKFITDNIAFDVKVKEETSNPIFPSYPYKDFEHKDKTDIYPNPFTKPIMCKDSMKTTTNRTLQFENGGYVSDYETEREKLEKAVRND